MKVFATCDIGADALDLLRRAGHELEVWPDLEPPPHELLVRKAAEADALVTTLRDRVDRAVVAAGRGRLKVIAQDAVGTDNIDLAAAAEAGIPVTHTADVLTEATAEFAFLILGAVSRRLAPSEAMVREGRWGSWHPWHPILGDEVTGKTVAVIGCGRIGRAFAAKCAGFDMDVLLVEKYLDADWLDRFRRLQQARAELRIGRRAARTEVLELSEALPRADYVSLHVPLIKEGPDRTLKLIGEPELRRMKPTAYLVNTSRGPVVDEAALARAVREGVVAGAALDVFEREPLPLDSPLLAADLADRVRVFHHFSSGTRETRLSTDPEVGMAGRTVAAVLDAFSGSPSWRYRVKPG